MSDSGRETGLVLNMDTPVSGTETPSRGRRELDRMLDSSGEQVQVKKGREMIVGVEANRDFDVMLKTKRTINASITHKINLMESELQNIPTDRPERLALAAATYLRCLIDYKLEEVINDKNY